MIHGDPLKPRRRRRFTILGVVVGFVLGYLPGFEVTFRLASDAWANETTKNAMIWTIVGMIAGMLPVLPIIVIGATVGGAIGYLARSPVDSSPDE